MLNDLLPEIMWEVIKSAGTHPVALIIKDGQQKNKEKIENKKRMNEAKEWMNESKIKLENFKKYLHKYQDELYKKKEILEEECKVCEKCKDIMSKHVCESSYDRCYSSEYGINIARSCWDYCLGCHFYKISHIYIELEESNGEFRDYKESAELAEWDYKYACAIYEGREWKFLSDIDDDYFYIT